MAKDIKVESFSMENHGASVTIKVKLRVFEYDEGGEIITPKYMNNNVQTIETTLLKENNASLEEILSSVKTLAFTQHLNKFTEKS